MATTEEEKKAIWKEAHAAATRLHGGKPEDALKAAEAAVAAFEKRFGETSPAPEK